MKFDDDTYQMYFKENGEAATGYFKNKYVIAGIVLKANNDDSNYALVETLPGQKTKLAAGFTEEKYANQVGFGTVSGSWYLVNASGTRLDGKNRVYKDSNDVYYVTTSDGSVGYISNTQVWNSKSKDHENLVYQNGTRKYYTE